MSEDRSPENGVPEGEGPEHGGGAERAVRREISARIGLRKRGYHQSKVDLVNISRTGFLIDASMSLGVGEQVWLNLPGFETRLAKVMWTDQFRAGCQFEQPFADYVFDALIAKLDHP